MTDYHAGFEGGFGGGHPDSTQSEAWQRVGRTLGNKRKLLRSQIPPQSLSCLVLRTSNAQTLSVQGMATTSVP
jgi:hypothetical protein